MRYLSTRGHAARLSFEETVMTGLAPDGGLFIPEHMPRLPADWQTRWRDLPFTALALEVYSLFVDPAEIPRADLQRLIEASYSTFRTPEVAPLHTLEPGTLDVLELFHGPTLAFKDVALQFLGNLFEYFLQRRNVGKADDAADRHRLTVVGATSGDTGSAAIYGLRGKKDVAIFILHPKGRVSPIQEAQMTTVLDDNVFNLACVSDFDGCQDAVKHLFADRAFNQRHHLGAVNSINWARILAQIVYYFASYFAVVRRDPAAEVRLQYVVPTGNFGDVLAGWYAKRLGLPMAPLVVATNANDILARFWRSGVYETADSSAPTPAPTVVSDGAQAASAVKETLSPAMDILVSSNFERLLWYLAFEAAPHVASAVAADGEVDGGAAARTRAAGEVVAGWMRELRGSGRVDVGREVHTAALRDFLAERVSDGETTETIRAIHERSQYVVDPHTAVGLVAAARVAKASSSPAHQIALATAHPAKFAAAVEKALPQLDFARDVTPPEFRGLLDLPRRVVDVPSAEPERVKEVVEREVSKLWVVPPVQPNGAISAAV